MSTEDVSAVITPSRNAYGRVFRERGTLKIVIGAALLYLAWYGYDAFQTNRANQVKWPTLPASKQGLVVLGLLDRPKDESKPRYKAIESNHSWRIHYNDEASGGDEDEQGTEHKERGNDPGSTHGVVRGAVVPLDELLRTLPVVMHGPNFTSANVEEKLEPLFDRKYWVVNVGLDREGRSRYWQFSREHDDERLVFLLNGDVVTCPRMKHMDVGELTIEQFWVKADADRLADFINHQNR